MTMWGGGGSFHCPVKFSGEKDVAWWGFAGALQPVLPTMGTTPHPLPSAVENAVVELSSEPGA